MGLIKIGIQERLLNKLPFDLQYGSIHLYVYMINESGLGIFDEYVDYFISELDKLDDRLIRDIAGTEIQKTKASKKGLRTDFEIPQSHWSKFARQYGQKQIVLEFSDEKIEQIIQSAVNSLDQSITDIFNNLADFTSSLQSYLTSTARNRGKDGEKAMQLAAGLPKQTSKIIKTGAVEG